MTITALAQWFGGNRLLAQSVGRALGRLRWCGVPFAGGCPELPHIRTAAEQQARLAEALAKFARTRVVVRYGDHPLIRDLYPEPRWTWLEQRGRNQRNGEIAEVLIVNGGRPT